MDYKKLVEEKEVFLKNLKPEWYKQAEAKGVFDPASVKDMKLKTSYKNN